MCRSQCFIEHYTPKQWTVFSRIIEPHNPDEQSREVVRVEYQGYVDDTVDHILPARPLTIKGEQVPCYHQGFEEASMSKDEVLNPPRISTTKRDSVEARCHCGAVSCR
jgi:hypothetical protein